MREGSYWWHTTAMRRESGASPGGSRHWQEGGTWHRATPTRMDDIRFDRHFRTPSSEGYHILRGKVRLGMIDLHFTSTTVHGTLLVEQELARAELARLIEQIDEDLVLSADTPRDDFLVSVFAGKEVGFFNDSFRADEDELVAAVGEEDDDDDEADE